jgi:hypothetical protein
MSLERGKKRSPNGEQYGFDFKGSHRYFSIDEATHMVPVHSYVVSENGELVKVTSNGYEYTGMFIED